MFWLGGWLVFVVVDDLFVWKPNSIADRMVVVVVEGELFE
jgi:hypothetical protein